MYRISTNMDLDNVKDDFILGFTLREVIFGVLSVVLSAGIICIMTIGFHVSIYVACYIAVPVVTPVALAGFRKKYGMYYNQYKIENHFCNKLQTTLYYETDNQVKKYIGNPDYENEDIFLNSLSRQERQKLSKDKNVKYLLSIPKEERREIFLKSKKFKILADEKIEVGENLTDYHYYEIVYKKRIHFTFLSYDKNIYDNLLVIPFLERYHGISYYRKKERSNIDK